MTHCARLYRQVELSQEIYRLDGLRSLSTKCALGRQSPSDCARSMAVVRWSVRSCQSVASYHRYAKHSTTKNEQSEIIPSCRAYAKTNSYHSARVRCLSQHPGDRFRVHRTSSTSPPQGGGLLQCVSRSWWSYLQVCARWSPNWRYCQMLWIGGHQAAASTGTCSRTNGATW